MDAELKQKWVEALRSGKYEQGRSQLRNGDEYCCLGVLCDVARLGQWVPGDDEQDGYWFDFGATETDDLLPVTVLQTLGMTFDQQDTCWRMNDEHKKSFVEIADHIERNF